MNRPYLQRCLKTAIGQAGLLRVLLAFLLVYFLLARQVIYSLGLLRPWLLPERRAQFGCHLLGERRQTFSQLLLAWLPGFDERPTPQRTRFFMFSAALGMTAVIASALASLPRQPGLLYSIPAYAVLVVLVMLQRQRKVEMLAA
jgi:hypothetical protein